MESPHGGSGDGHLGGPLYGRWFFPSGDVVMGGSPINQEMRVDCSWCGAWIRGPQNRPADSHGICRACATAVLAQVGLAIVRDSAGVAHAEAIPQPGSGGSPTPRLAAPALPTTPEPVSFRLTV
jgi:hypothetical protein